MNTHADVDAIAKMAHEMGAAMRSRLSRLPASAWSMWTVSTEGVPIATSRRRDLRAAITERPDQKSEEDRH
jgi:hypothetical protein